MTMARRGKCHPSAPQSRVKNLHEHVMTSERTRSDTLFDLRYAVRVLERQARMWGLVGAAFKFASVLSGTVALAALTGEKTPLAIGMGMVFAVLQAAEIAVGPTGKSSNALSMRRDYARLYARESTLSDAALEDGYQAIVADDEIVVGHALKELAFNDVVLERGLNAADCYPNRPWLRALS
jgi:hypothetical protein